MAEGRTHKPVIRADRCGSCNICLRGCPAAVEPEYRREPDSLRGLLYREKVLDSKPGAVTLLPACQESCPVRQDTRGYAALAAKGNFSEALALIRETNPLPSICGYVCHHPCEAACLREGVDSPVPLRLLKRFVAEQGMGEPEKIRIKSRKGSVLVLGSGPAGLAAAHDLRLLGYAVNVWEALPVLGGMLRVGIPEFRLPREIISSEIKRIESLGVEMITDRPFRPGGKGWSSLRKGRDAVFVAVGAHRSARLELPGRNAGRKGFLNGVEFLRAANLGKKIDLGRLVAVIGGGNVAIDAARTALRCGAERVEIYYRRSRREMPAIPEDVDEAVREGIRLNYLSAPLRIQEKNETVLGLECQHMKLAEPDERGRRRPVPVPGSSFRVKADTIIAAIGQRTDERLLKGLELNGDGTIKVDPATGETSLKGFFAGGDVVTGPGWAIDAIAAGKKAAQSIHQYLS
jgi:heterodisulfide reductase subunit A2